MKNHSHHSSCQAGGLACLASPQTTEENYAMADKLYLRLDELVKENAGLSLKLKAAETEIDSLESANARLGNELLTLNEKLENANNEISRLDMVMKHRRDDLVTIRRLGRKNWVVLPEIKISQLPLL
jgi:predicted nuclease with TOPRIM domain